MIDAVGRALNMAFAMGWEILWPLILGFTLSAVVQAVISHREMSRLLPDDRTRSIITALALGAASSSCSYAAVALARSIFRKGANFTAAMAFEMASTNLVLELSIIMLALLGWQFALAEFVGAPIMVVLLVFLFRKFLTRYLLDQAKESLTSLKEKLIKVGAKIVSRGRYVAFQMAEVAIPRNLFADILRMIGECAFHQ
jgi:uncharacterized protein